MNVAGFMGAAALWGAAMAIADEGVVEAEVASVKGKHP